MVGNNESGKSTVLETAHMALSGIFRGKSIKNNLTQYLFNYDVVKQYLSDVNSGHIVEAPYILIELFISKGSFEEEAARFLEKYYPKALKEAVPVPIRQIAFIRLEERG